jgi:hypothetical protein
MSFSFRKNTHEEQNYGRHDGASRFHSAAAAVTLSNIFPIIPELIVRHSRVLYGVTKWTRIYSDWILNLFATKSQLQTLVMNNDKSHTNILEQLVLLNRNSVQSLTLLHNPLSSTQCAHWLVSSTAYSHWLVSFNYLQKLNSFLSTHYLSSVHWILNTNWLLLHLN